MKKNIKQEPVAEADPEIGKMREWVRVGKWYLDGAKACGNVANIKRSRKENWPFQGIYLNPFIYSAQFFASNFQCQVIAHFGQDLRIINVIKISPICLQLCIFIGSACVLYL